MRVILYYFFLPLRIFLCVLYDQVLEGSIGEEIGVGEGETSEGVGFVSTVEPFLDGGLVEGEAVSGEDGIFHEGVGNGADEVGGYDLFLGFHVVGCKYLG